VAAVPARGDGPAAAAARGGAEPIVAHRTTWGWVAALLCAAASAARADPAEAPTPPDDLTLLALALALSSSDAPHGAGAPSGAASDPDAPPRTEIVATVRAKALRLDEVPDAEALLVLARRTSWTAERLNLPVRPEPGAVYRDVEVRLTVAGDLDDVTALLAEARRAARGIRIEPEPPPSDADVPAIGRPGESP
jgi:hypothetical protein